MLREIRKNERDIFLAGEYFGFPSVSGCLAVL